MTYTANANKIPDGRDNGLIPPPLFAAMREAGPLPVVPPATAATYPAERKALLNRRLAEVAAKATADKLQNVRIQGGELKITPLKAATPEQAEELADRLYAMLPNVRITALLAEVDQDRVHRRLHASSDGFAGR